MKKKVLLLLVAVGLVFNSGIVNLLTANDSVVHADTNKNGTLKYLGEKSYYRQKDQNKYKNATWKIQEALNYSNSGHKTIAADGYYGWETVASVKTFQKKHGLSQDGVVGPATWKKLIKYLPSFFKV